MSLQRPGLYGDPASINALAGWVRENGFIRPAFAGDDVALGAADLSMSGNFNLTGALALSGSLALAGAVGVGESLFSAAGTAVGATGTSVRATASGAELTSSALRVSRVRDVAGPVGDWLDTSIVDLEGHAADAGTVVSALHVRALTDNGGTPNYQGIILEGNADTLLGSFDRAIACFDTKCWITAANFTAGLTPSEIAIMTNTALAGESSGGVRIVTGNSDTSAADIQLKPGIDTVGADHGSVLCSSSAVAQIPLQAKAFAGQTGNLTEWLNSADVILAAITSKGYLSLTNGAGGAGSGSNKIEFLAETSVATRTWSINAIAEVATDDSSLVFGGGGQLTLYLDFDGTGDRIRANAPFKRAQGGGAALHAAIAAPYVVDVNVDADALQFTTTDGSVQDVQLPPEEAGLQYMIQNNTGSPGSIRVLDDASGAIVTIGTGQLAILRSQAGAWLVFGPWAIP